MNNTILDINNKLTDDELVTLKKLLEHLKPFLDNNGQISDNGTSAAFEKLLIMSKDGTLESLIEIITFIVAMKNSMTTEIIVKVTQLIPDPALLNKVERTIDATKKTKEELDRNTTKIGIWGLISALKDPDIQYILNYLLVLSKKLSKIAKD